jgi:ribosomal protein L37AE/L43A
MVKKFEISLHAKYTCSFGGKAKMRQAVGIWTLRESAHYNSGWWYLDLQHDFSNHSQVCHQKTEEIKRPVEALPFETSLAYNKMG